MRGPWDLVHGAERPLSVVRLGINRLIRSDVRVAEKIAGGHDDVTERGHVVNGSEAILRSLGVVRRFETVSDGRRGKGGGGCLLRCHFLFPFSVLTHAE